tara:strand:+ start:1122 stop:1268 length:147 start_codon:yes stop_codon:yes gene_type:complete
MYSRYLIVVKLEEMYGKQKPNLRKMSERQKRETKKRMGMQRWRRKKRK